MDNLLFCPFSGMTVVQVLNVALPFFVVCKSVCNIVVTCSLFRLNNYL